MTLAGKIATFSDSIIFTRQRVYVSIDTSPVPPKKVFAANIFCAKASLETVGDELHDYSVCPRLAAA